MYLTNDVTLKVAVMNHTHARYLRRLSLDYSGFWTDIMKGKGEGNVMLHLIHSGWSIGNVVHPSNDYDLCLLEGTRYAFT